MTVPHNSLIMRQVMMLYLCCRNSGDYYSSDRRSLDNLIVHSFSLDKPQRDQ